MHSKSVTVSAIIILGAGVDAETGRKVDEKSASRIKTGTRRLLRTRQDGKGIIILAPGKPPQDGTSWLLKLKRQLGKTEQVWRSTQTFAEIMANEVRMQMHDIMIDELIINHDDDTVWTTWREIDWAVDVAKSWYCQNYKHQMVSWNDYNHLKIIFVSDKNHLAIRIPLMAREKLGYHWYPPTDDRYAYTSEDERSLVWMTEPLWSKAPADHHPTPIWYEVLAVIKFLYHKNRGRL